jgi:tetratricopeptide (TPR) repeat protein
MEPGLKEAISQVKIHLNQAKSALEQYKNILSAREYGLNDDSIFRWQARFGIAFAQQDESNSDPVEVLSSHSMPGDTAAIIDYLRLVNLRTPESDSITRIIKIARTYPKNPLVLLHVGLVLSDDNPTDAMKSIQVALDNNPFTQNPIVAFCQILLARIATSLKKYDVAREAIEQALGIWEDEPEWHVLASKIYKQVPDNTGAINHLIEATRLDPKSISYQLELGKTYFENAYDDFRKLKQAAHHFENAIKLDPGHIDARLFLAKTQYLLNDTKSSEENARNALVSAPGGDIPAPE